MSQHLVTNELNRIADGMRAKKKAIQERYDNAQSSSELDQLIHERGNMVIAFREFVEQCDAAGYVIDYTQEDLK